MRVAGASHFCALTLSLSGWRENEAARTHPRKDQIRQGRGEATESAATETAEGAGGNRRLEPANAPPFKELHVDY